MEFVWTSASAYIYIGIHRVRRRRYCIDDLYNINRFMHITYITIMMMKILIIKRVVQILFFETTAARVTIYIIYYIDGPCAWRAGSTARP